MTMISLGLGLSAIPGQATSNGVAVCTAPNGQSESVIASDGAGGAIIAWMDERSGGDDIYVQRVNAAGKAQWTANGVALCTEGSTQSGPAIVSDGAGGAIVAWVDARNGSTFDIYVQRVNSAGVPQWTADGVGLAAQANSTVPLAIVSDGGFGAIIAWEDGRNYPFDLRDIYAQRVNASGAPLWTAGGVAVCAAASEQFAPTIVSSGFGAAIVTWDDYRGGSSADIYAQRVDASGVPQWTLDGVALCANLSSQINPIIASDGSSGAIVAWTDYRNGNPDGYVQRVDVSGVPQWTSNGVALCTGAGSQYPAGAVSDGAGGAIVTWADNGIYARRVNASGVPQWTLNGVALCTGGTVELSVAAIVSDGANGAIVAWDDFRNINTSDRDVYARRINSSGVPQWTANGVVVCDAPGIQSFPGIASDGASGAIVCWNDRRSGAFDVYVQRVTSAGSTDPMLTNLNAGLPVLYRSALAWGDYDNDGDLDLVAAGTDGVGPQTHLYRNDGGTFVDAGAGLPGVEWCSLAWGDYDGDGDLDLAISGWNAGPLITRIYRNDGGNFVDINAGLPGVIYGAVAWGDFDNDGDLDLLVAGNDGTTPIARLYRNNSGVFADIGAGLTGVQHCDADWGDWDGDGDLDLVLAGNDGSSGLTRIYRNNGGTFVNAAAGLPGVWEGDVEWGDYDSDGKLDLVVTGWTGAQRLSRVYHNTGGGTLVDIGAGLVGLSSSAVAWGDFDNDGDLDLVLAGASDSNPGEAHVYRNDGGTFVAAGTSLPGSSYSAVAWGDFDGDGDLDLAYAGYSVATAILRSEWTPINTPPGTPGNLNTVRNGNQVTFSWSAPSDDHTAAAGLSYNLRVGTTSGGHQKVAAHAAASGYRRVARRGNAQQGLSWTLTLAPGIYYYWSVQAIDGAFLGSAFAAEGGGVGVEGALPRPTAIVLDPVTPSPFATNAAIGYALPSGGAVDLAIYDVSGARVRVLAIGEEPAGKHTVGWDGRNESGHPEPDGVYWVRLAAAGHAWSRKLVLAR